VVDENKHERGRVVADDEMATINLQPDAFHGEWYHTILPEPNDTNA
jgi:hypothetical protein